MSDFESRLTQELHALVDGEHPSPELRESIAQELATGRPSLPSRRRWMPAAAAALLVIAGIGALASTRGGDPGVDVATDPETATLADDDDGDDEDTTATTAATTTSPTTAPTTTLVPEPEDDGTPPDQVVPVDPGSGPATTVPQCHNSTDPACGAFYWSPEPTNQPATLTIEAPDTLRAGQSEEITLTMSDPDGPVTFSCFSVAYDGGGSPQVGGPCVVVRQDCPARYGPWSPPAPKPDQATTYTNVQFDNPGTYEITVSVEPADGCDNVDPYRSGASASITVEVVAE